MGRYKYYFISILLCLLAVMCWGFDVSAERPSRKLVTDTITGETGKEYTISYYNVDYYDGSNYFGQNVTVMYGDKNIIGHYELDDDAPFFRMEDNGESRIINATITGLDEYADLSYSFTYTFYPFEFDTSYVAEKDHNAYQPLQIYSGSPIEPVMSVHTNKWNKDTNSYYLNSQYYTVSYENNVNAGKAKAIVKGIGLYTGTLELEFEIIPVVVNDYTVHDYLMGDRSQPVPGLKESVYIIEEIDSDRHVARLQITDENKGNYCFSVLSTAVAASVNCTGIRIENYDEQYSYKQYPDGELMLSDGTYSQVCNTHTLKQIYRYNEPSCEGMGHEDVFKCSVCGRYFKSQDAKEEILHLDDTIKPATGHSFGDWEVAHETTYYWEGQMEQKCSICGLVNYKVIPRLDEKPAATTEGSVKASAGSGEKGQSQPSGDTDDNSDYNDGITSDDEEEVDVPSVSGLKLASKKKKQIVIAWNKMSDIDGYEINYGTDKKYKKFKTKKLSKSKKSFTVSKLKSRKKYYVRIRAYKKYTDRNGDTQIAYGSWSSKNKKCK